MLWRLIAGELCGVGKSAVERRHKPMLLGYATRFDNDIRGTDTTAHRD